jgi:hypothetical protein
MGRPDGFILKSNGLEGQKGIYFSVAEFYAMSIRYLLNSNKKRLLIKALAVLFFAWSLEATLMPNIGATFVKADKEGHGEEALKIFIGNVLENERTGLKEADERGLAGFIVRESARRGIDPLFVLALIRTESGFYNPSRSSQGAIGLMQILPSTGMAVAEELNINWHGDDVLLDPYMNVKIGIHYLKGLLKTYDNDANISLAAYNAGPNRVSERLRLGGTIGGPFPDRVLENYRELKERAEFYLNG